MEGKAFPNAPYTLGTVISSDGTLIGYRQFGNGPGLILVHGGMMGSQNFIKLAAALSDAYTVYVPDRRGRGLSGPFGEYYSMAKECEDIQALIHKTGANYIFGLSSGTLIALQAALTLPPIQKAALYEPPLPVEGANPLGWATRFDEELAKGSLASAMVSVIKGAGDSWSMATLPRFLLEALMKLAVRYQQEPQKDEVPLHLLIPTQHFDIMLVKEMVGKLHTFNDVKAKVLLLGGNRSKPFLKKALDALGKVLPYSERITLPAIGHLAADNSGKPELVAKELKRFFG